MNTRHAIIALSLAAVGFASGCSSYQYDKDFFDFDRNQSRTRSIFTAQANKGAAEDAAMRTHHFDVDHDGAVTLNSLGRAKLDAMVAHHAGRPFTVMIDMPADQLGCESAVSNYLTAAAVTPGMARIEWGQSPMASRVSSSSDKAEPAAATDPGAMAGSLFGQ